jgi:predicted Fe-Mo cluster-binding NifX family protein
MKIAVPESSNGHLESHFGQCEYFTVYTVTDDRKITEAEKVPSPDGCGCKSGIAAVLARKGVKLMLAGGIGNGAVNVLASQGIRVIRGCSGRPEDLISRFLEGSLIDSGENCHQHDEHQHQHEHRHHS